MRVRVKIIRFGIRVNFKWKFLRRSASKLLFKMKRGVAGNASYVSILAVESISPTGCRKRLALVAGLFVWYVRCVSRMLNWL